MLFFWAKSFYVTHFSEKRLANAGWHRSYGLLSGEALLWRRGTEEERY